MGGAIAPQIHSSNDFHLLTPHMQTLLGVTDAREVKEEQRKSEDGLSFILHRFFALLRKQDNASAIMSSKSAYSVQVGSMLRLEPGRWLNDEVINAYISLLP